MAMHKENEMAQQQEMFSNAESDWVRQTLSKWADLHLLEVIQDTDVLPQVVMNMPHNVARGNAMKIKELQELSLQGMKHLSLQLRQVTVDISANVHLGIDISWEEYQNNVEVREFLGDLEGEFISTSVVCDSPLHMTLELELLKEPPMVVSYKLRKIAGDATSVEFKI
jgi:hypothetical protein